MKEGVAAEAVPDIFLKLDKMRHKKWLNFQVLGNETVIDPFFLSDAHSLGACCLKRRCRKHGKFWDKIVGKYCETEFDTDKIHFLRFPSQARISWITTSFSSQNLYFITLIKWIGDKLEITKITYSLSINFSVFFWFGRQSVSWRVETADAKTQQNGKT